MVKKECLICGRIFFTYPFYIKRGERKFCSRQCYAKSIMKEQVSITCKFCKKVFKKHPGIKKYNRKFCSVQCFHDFVDKNGPWNFSGTERIRCANPECKKIFISKICLHRKYCSMQCQWDCRKLFTGSKSGSWRGGVSFEPYAHDFSRSLKFMIRERFNFLCVECGSEKRTRDHSIHHVDFNKKNSRLSNFFPLCDKCHPITNHRPDVYIPYFRKKMRLFNSFNK